MREKYILRSEFPDDVVLGVYYVEDEKRVVVGGSHRWIEEAQKIINYFQPRNSHKRHAVVQHSQSHRTRLTMTRVSKQDWDIGLAEIGMRGWRLRPTRSFRRLMS